MKFICEIFSRMSITFRDESNEPSSIMFGYSDTTVTVHNHPLNMRSKAFISYNICYSTIIVDVVL